MVTAAAEVVAVAVGMAMVAEVAGVVTAAAEVVAVAVGTAVVGSVGGHHFQPAAAIPV